MKRLIPSLLTLALLLTLGACKPTEKNYQQAYEIAKQKKERELSSDPDMPAEGYISQDAPKRHIVEGDTIPFYREHLSAVWPDSAAVSRLNIVVAMYKMSTNAVGQAKGFADKGLPAMALKSTGARYFVSVDTAANWVSAGQKLEKFKKENPQFPYVGLAGYPVVIEAANVK